MKKAEAISILATSVRPREAKDRARYDEAVKMAIEALKCSETPKSSERTSETAQPEKQLATDTISRQAALDAIMGQPPEPHYPSWYAAQIEKLPSAQPDHVADIGKKAEGDCISRQAAIDALDCINGVEEVLRSLPSAQPDHNADIGKKVSISCAHENDVVSRKAAIEAIEKAKMAQTPDGEIYVAKYNAEMNIRLLPTVQPVLTCDGCQHNGYFKHDICRRCLRNMRDLYEPE